MTIFILIFILTFQPNATLVSVVDGDTLIVIFQGKKDCVRLIGYDAPESKKNKKAIRDSKRTGESLESIIKRGKRAKKRVEKLIKKGDPLQLKFPKGYPIRDKFHRLLSDVILDGNISLTTKFKTERLTPNP